MRLPLRHPLVARTGPPLALGLLRAVFATIPGTITGDPRGVSLFCSPDPVIFALWHGHLLTTLYLGRLFAQRKPGIVIMTSPSRDGEFIAAVARRLGYFTVSGSRQKGGLKALQELVVRLRGGFSAAIVADGSRGPAHVVQKGVLYLARETQAPILPFAAALKRKIILNTWDRFEVPLPWNRAALLVGPPLSLPPELRGPDLEAHRLLLEERLQDLFLRSRRFFSG